MSQDQSTSSVRPQLPPDPLLEQTATPDMLQQAGWELQADVQIGEWRTFARRRPGEARHYCVTYVHQVITLTTLPPITPVRHS